MIGWYCVASFPYYDNRNSKRSFKKRPMLVIGQADSRDYVTLPISKVSHRENVDAEYDISIQIIEYPLLKLNFDSYIRTHKQTTINSAEITRKVVNVQKEYPELWIEVLSKLEDFQRKLINAGL